MRGLSTAFGLGVLLSRLLAISVAQPQSIHGPECLTRHCRHRRTMSFGPELPSAIFRTVVPDDLQPSHIFSSARSRKVPHPFDVAREFAKKIIPQAALVEVDDEFTDVTSFYVRNDSYIDRQTGIAHVYVRQQVHDTEIVNGGININIDIEDGRILSYGASIYASSIPEVGMYTTFDTMDVQATYCEQLVSELSDRLDQFVLQATPLAAGFTPWSVDYQTTLGWQSDEELSCFVFNKSMQSTAQEMMGRVGSLAESNCNAYCPFSNTDFLIDHAEETPLGALLNFMAAVLPFDLAEDIVEDPAPYWDNVTVSADHPLPGEEISDRTPVMNISNVVGTTGDVKAKLAWMQVPTEEDPWLMGLELVWKLEVPMEHNWYHAAVTFNIPHRIISVVDWVVDGSTDGPTLDPSNFDFPFLHESTQSASRPPVRYRVFALDVSNPSASERTFQYENFDTIASPIGWHVAVGQESTKDSSTTSTSTFLTTSGNNVFALAAWSGEAYSPESAVDEIEGKGLEFNFAYDPQDIDEAHMIQEARKHVNASITQMFYTANMVHDLFYMYGFDEVAGNFQQHNFDRGGEENDGITAVTQDGPGFNHASFMAPPDGRSGRLIVSLWDTADVYRDGAMDVGMVIHQLAHGLSSRVVGGPADADCLGWGESAALGEGWSDFFATMILSATDTKVEEDHHVISAWAINEGDGLRRYPYSADETINPVKYSTLSEPEFWGFEAMGEVWAEILWVVSRHLIQKLGSSNTLFPPKRLDDGKIPLGDFYVNTTGKLVPKHGNTLMMQLVVDSMKLLPCRPSFFDARDALIAADHTLTGGTNYCELWTGFAERGLGPDAVVDIEIPWGGGTRIDDFEIPGDCYKIVS